MIDRSYLESLLRDVQAQLAEHERNAVASRGAIQILEHLLSLSENPGAESQPAPENKKVKEN